MYSVSVQFPKKEMTATVSLNVYRDPSSGNVIVTNSSGSYSKTLSPGNTLTLPNITHTDSDGSTVNKPAQESFTCTPVANATVYESDGSTVVTTISPGGSYNIPTHDILYPNGSTNVSNEFNEDYQEPLSLSFIVGDGATESIIFTLSETGQEGTITSATSSNMTSYDIEKNGVKVADNTTSPLSISVSITDTLQITNIVQTTGGSQMSLELTD